MIDPGSIITAASIVAGFGVTVLMFRLQRELAISDANWRRRKQESTTVTDTATWLPLADLLVLVAVLMALLVGVAPLLMSASPSANDLSEAAAASAAATVLLAGYVPSILAHYNMLVGLDKTRRNPQPLEAIFVLATVTWAAVTYVRVLRSFA